MDATPMRAPTGGSVTPPAAAASSPTLRQLARWRWILHLAASLSLLAALVGFVAGLLRLSYAHGAPSWIRTLWFWGQDGLFLGALASTTFLLAGGTTCLLPAAERCGEGSVTVLPGLRWLTVERMRRITLLGAALLIPLAYPAWRTAVHGVLQVPGHHLARHVSGPLELFLWSMGSDALYLLGYTAVVLALAGRLGREGSPSLPSPRVSPLLPPNSLSDPPDGGVETAEVAVSTEAPCPVCGVPVGPAPTVCPRCSTPHHADCFAYAGGCAIFGCRAKERPSAVPSSVVSSSSLRSSSLPSLARDLRTWLVLHRASWAALCVAMTGATLLAWSVIFPVRGETRSEMVLGPLITFGDRAASWGSLLGAIGLILYVLLSFLARRHHRAVSRLAEDATRPAGPGLPDAVASLTASIPGQGLHALLSSLTLGSATLLLLAPVGLWWYGDYWFIPPGAPFAAVALVVSLLLPLALLRASVAREAHVVSLQNRLAATITKGSSPS